METFEINLNSLDIMQVLYAIDTRCELLRNYELFAAADRLADLGMRIRCAAEQQGWS